MRKMLMCGALSLAVGGGAAAAFQAGPAERPTDEPAPGADGDWLHYGRTAGGDRFSPLAQITPANVSGLKVAWTYRLGPASDGRMAGLEATPLKVGDTLYLCSSENVVDAIDAETGRRRWRFDPKTNLKNGWVRACRGVAYYRVPGATGDCAERIYAATLDARLLAVDARTGRACAAFGEKGTVDLSKGFGGIGLGYYSLTSPPTVIRRKLVVGGAVTDGQRTGEPSGVVRAFDAVTGGFVWAWDPGREPVTTEPGPGETYTHGTPNVWAPASADEALGLVYLPTGNATPDYFGGHRRPFDDKYSSSVVALDAETGRPRWSFQTLHHDIWDYDVPAQPTLIDLHGPSGDTPALIQATKRGEIFVLDRRTGRPVFPVEERPVPQGGVAGERVSATQPFTVGMPTFGGPTLRERDMWGVTPLDQLLCRILFKRARYEGTLTPPGLRESLNQPGTLGGVDWGGVAVDPARQLMVVNSNRLANILKLVPRAEAEALGVKPRGQPGGRPQPGYSAQGGTPYAVRSGPFLSPLGIPCQAPPYGEISAVDLQTRKTIWRKPLGTARDNGPFGQPSGLPFTLGTPNTGGAVVTKSGLVFIGATQEQAFRAFDTRTGKLLWMARLPAAGNATPMSYVSPTSGRQFVLIVAGGHATLRSRKGDYVIAYSLEPKG